MIPDLSGINLMNGKRANASNPPRATLELNDMPDVKCVKCDHNLFTPGSLVFKASQLTSESGTVEIRTATIIACDKCYNPVDDITKINDNIGPNIRQLSCDCGCQLFRTAIQIKRISRFISGQPNDIDSPIPIFKCFKCNTKLELV